MTPPRTPRRAAAAALAEAWTRAFEAFAASRDDAAWMRALREEAIARFAEQGLPHRKLEAWRYTSLAALERREWAAPAGSPDAASAITREQIDAVARLPREAVHRVVLVDGRIAASLSDLPDASSGIVLHAFDDACRGGGGEDVARALVGRLAEPKNDAFAALATAFADGGAVLEIPARFAAEAPLHLLFVHTRADGLAAPRLAVAARSGSRAVVVEDHVALGAGARFVDSVAELHVEADARLDWVLVQRGGDEDVHVSNLQARQERDSRLAVHTLSLGGALVRNELGVVLADTGAEADLRGLFLGAGERIVDNHTQVDHAMPHCSSRELYKGVLGGASRGVFRGRVVVRPDAQKTDATQSNANLLLTDRAEVDTRPQLEIHADDVKCSHGSTIGQLDADALFYLRARGIGEADARLMLTRGFANEIGDGLPGDALSAWAAPLVAEALTRALGEETR